MAAGDQPTLFSGLFSGPAGDADPPVRLVSHGPAAREALWGLVEAAQRDDPLAPVTVAVPSPYAGLSLRRELGGRGGFLNVHFVALARIAELLGAPALAATGRRPLAGPLRAEAVHAALVADPGPFADVAEHPSTAARLAATFRDLRRARLEPPLAPLASRGPRAGAVARLYADVRRHTTDYYDEEDLLAAAADTLAAAAGGIAAEVGTVVVYLPRSLSPAETVFVRSLVDAGRAVVLLGLTGDADADAAQHDAARALGADGRDSPDGRDASTPTGTHVLAAADPEDEVRAVARRIAIAAEDGIPLHSQAVVYRLAEPYARLVPEILESAGIAWNGPSPRRLAECVVARVLLGVLHLADDDLARDDVAAWLATGPVRDAAGSPVPAARWDVVSREAGVVGSAAQWTERLARHRAALEARLLAVESDDEQTWLVTRLTGDLENVDALTEFVTELAERVAPPPTHTWSAHATWAAGLVDRYLGTDAQRARWPDAELEAGRRVETLLAGLTALDQLGAPVDLGRFRRALAGELDVPLGRHERYGIGVFVGPLSSAYAAHFERVFVLGMAEGSFPPRGREDPLLPDADRRLLDGTRLEADRRAEERRDYLAALATAPDRVLCFPRSDPRAQRKRLPARWLLTTASSLDGVDLGAGDFLELGDRAWLDVVESFERGVTADAVPGSLTEHDLRALGDWRAASLPLRSHPLAAGAFGAGLELLEARASGRLTAFDGGVGAGRGLLPDATNPISPTALQDWATCPFRYLLARVLRVRDVPKPEATDTISPLDEGTLVHTILEEFLVRAPARTSPEQPWDDADRTLLAAIAVEACDDAERRGVTGRPLHWRFARRRVLGAAARFLDVDQRTRAQLGVVPSPGGLEVPFGDAATPVTLDLPGDRTVAFRGRIDRIDRSPDGALTAVYDYKTGRASGVSADDPVESGRRLQLPVYSLAARARAGSGDSRAFYWYTRAAAEDAVVEFPVDGAHHDRFVDVVTKVVGGIGDGCFVAYPGTREWRPNIGDTFDNCMYCPYDRLCSPDRLGAWYRKAEDPAIASFHALDPEPADAEVDDA